MDFNKQLDLIKKKHAKKYDKFLHREEIKKKISNKFKDDIELNKVKLAAARIVRYIRKKFFNNCYYDNDNIPPLHRFRLLITNHHLVENDSDDEDMKKAINMNLQHNTKSYPLFRYCFDINDLFLKRNKIFDVNNLTIMLTENDIQRLEKNWNKVSGETNTSLIFLTDFDYYKNLAKDQLKDPQFINKLIKKFNCGN